MNYMFTQFRKGGMMVNDMMESMPITPAAGQQVSFFERMKQYLNPAQLKQAIITSKDTIIEMGIYLVLRSKNTVSTYLWHYYVLRD